MRIVIEAQRLDEGIDRQAALGRHTTQVHSVLKQYRLKAFIKPKSKSPSSPSKKAMERDLKRPLSVELDVFSRPVPGGQTLSTM